MHHYPNDMGWQRFHHQVEVLQRLCQRHRQEPLAPSQCLSRLVELRQSFQSLMTEGAIALDTVESNQRHVTELHRLLRLLLTDAALCQSARSVPLQQQRFGQLFQHLTQLYQHSQAILATLAQD